MLEKRKKKGEGAAQITMTMPKGWKRLPK